MRLAYFPDQIALNGKPILNAFLESAKSRGFSLVENTTNADAAVIWSVLWNGRLLKNKAVFEHFRNRNKPVFILEVGSLNRGQTWKVALNNTVGDGIYGHFYDLDQDRPRKLGISLSPEKQNRRSEILIACQHFKSHQWAGQPTPADWLKTKIIDVQKYTDRPIIVRYHPRSPLSLNIAGVTKEIAKKIKGSEYEYNLDYNYHCIINHNSGPSIISPIKGTPIICDKSSLASPVSSHIETIENINFPDREEWFLKICHTEWTEEEIQNGIPLNRLLNFTNC